MLFRNIVVFIDSSESAIIAAMHAVLLAKESGADLSAVYVVDTKSVGDLLRQHIFVDVEKDLYEKDLQGDAQRYLRQVRKLAERKGVEIDTHVLQGSAASEMKRYIKENKVDLLVMGGVSEIRSRREEMLSDSDRLLRTAGCPTLLVRDDSDIWEQFEEER